MPEAGCEHPFEPDWGRERFISHCKILRFVWWRAGVFWGLCALADVTYAEFVKVHRTLELYRRFSTSGPFLFAQGWAFVFLGQMLRSGGPRGLALE